MASTKYIGLLLSFAIMFILAANIIYAIGMSPASVKFDQMVRGGYAERYVTVSNTADEDMAVRVGVEGNVNSWIRVEPENITIRPMTTEIFKIVAEPPSDIANGVYKGNMIAVGQPASLAGMEGTGIATVSGVSAAIEAVIADTEIKDYDVETVTAYDTEECRELILRVGIRNTGNVRINPRFVVEIKDRGQTQTLQKLDTIEEEILPTKVQTYTLRVPYSMEQFTCIPQGNYYMDFSAYVDDELVEHRALPFSIHPRGFLTIAGEIQKITAKTEAMMGEIIKIDVMFKNIGKLPVKAKIKGEIYQDGMLTGIIESDEREVSIGVADTLTMYFTPGWIGKYTVKAVGMYEGRETQPKEIVIDVQPSMLFYAIISVIVLALIGGMFFFVRRKKAPVRRHKRR